MTLRPARMTQRDSMSQRAAELSFGICQDRNTLVQRDGSGGHMLSGKPLLDMWADN